MVTLKYLWYTSFGVIYAFLDCNSITYLITEICKAFFVLDIERYYGELYKVLNKSKKNEEAIAAIALSVVV